MPKGWLHHVTGTWELEVENGALIALRLANSSPAITCEDGDVLRHRSAVASYLDGTYARYPLPLTPKGTPFQSKVWEALQRIPYGQTVSYKQLAENIGAPLAFRAVGTACGTNPIALVIPCHRVLATGGGLGGYAYGLEVKQRLLAYESAPLGMRQTA